MLDSNKIRQLCEEVVKDLLPGGISSFQEDIDIVESGFDSIRIMALLARLQDLFKVKFNADEISIDNFRTINEITDLVKKKLAEQPKLTGSPALQCSAMVSLKADGSKFPFLCVPPLARSPYALTNFIPYFDKDRPFWSFRPQGLHGEAPPHTSIEDMAVYFISAMREQRFSSPYLLGGMCFGSLVAFEMACQLESQGEVVAKIVVFDELLPPGSPEFRPQKSKHSVRHLYPYLDRMEAIHLKARAKYSPGIYKGDMTFFHTTEYNTADEIRAGWSPLVAGEVDVQEMPGVHGGGVLPGAAFISEPHIITLARKLNDCLDRTEKEMRIQ